jgi:hypothetical protein
MRPGWSSYADLADGGGPYDHQPPATATAGAAAKGAKHCEHHGAASGDVAPHDVQLRTS